MTDEELFKSINEARHEAYKRGVNANTVFLDIDFAKKTQSLASLFDKGLQAVLTPTICGLKVRLVNFAPSDKPFLVAYMPEDMTRIQKRLTDKELCIELIHRLQKVDDTCSYCIHNPQNAICDKVVVGGYTDICYNGIKAFMEKERTNGKTPKN